MKRSKTYQVCDCRHWELSHKGNAGLGLLSITVSTASMEIRFRWRLSHGGKLSKRPLAYVDVFVDDFLGAGQDRPSKPLENQRRVLMRAVDQVFRPSDDEDHEQREEPNSVSKLSKGDADRKSVV